VSDKLPWEAWESSALSDHYPAWELHYKGAAVAVFDHENDAREAAEALNVKHRGTLKRLYAKLDASGWFVGQEDFEAEVMAALGAQ
jgi:hypothetical protein